MPFKRLVKLTYRIFISCNTIPYEKWTLWSTILYMYDRGNTSAQKYYILKKSPRKRGYNIKTPLKTDARVQTPQQLHPLGIRRFRRTLRPDVTASGEFAKCHLSTFKFSDARPYQLRARYPPPCCPVPIPARGRYQVRPTALCPDVPFISWQQRHFKRLLKLTYRCFQFMYSVWKINIMVHSTVHVCTFIFDHNTF